MPSAAVGGFGRLSGLLVELLVGARGVRLVPSLGLNTARKDEQQLPIPERVLSQFIWTVSKTSPIDTSFAWNCQRLAAGFKLATETAARLLTDCSLAC